FSSRRRHTRFSRDWSSDVCSSDLLLDVVMEGTDKPGKDEDGFDGNVAILTGELSALIPDLLEALGGEMGEAAAPAAPAAAEAEADRKSSGRERGEGGGGGGAVGGG